MTLGRPLPSQVVIRIGGLPARHSAEPSRDLRKRQSPVTKGASRWTWVKEPPPRLISRTHAPQKGTEHPLAMTQSAFGFVCHVLGGKRPWSLRRPNSQSLPRTIGIDLLNNNILIIQKYIFPECLFFVERRRLSRAITLSSKVLFQWNPKSAKDSRSLPLIPPNLVVSGLQQYRTGDRETITTFCLGWTPFTDCLWLSASGCGETCLSAEKTAEGSAMYLINESATLTSVYECYYKLHKECIMNK